jgi:endoglucanase
MEAEEEEENEAEDWEAPDAPPTGSPVALHGRLRVEGTQIVNEAGEPVQLKGISTQWLNYEGSFSQNKDAVVWMRDHWNIQLFRGAMGIEGSGGYLQSAAGMTQAIETVIRNSIDAGVYVLVDWHDHNAHAHLAEATNFFAQMAAKWGHYPHIIWETYNEPTPQNNGTWATIKPYHEAVLAQIRESSDNIVVMGNPFWSQRPDEAAADPVLGENIMYTLHFYACDHGANIRANAQAALDLGAPVFVTEWGATNADGGVLPGGRVCEDEASLWHDWMDLNQISWAAWKLQGCTDLSCIFTGAAPFAGGWTAADLQGHGPFVVEKLTQ